MCQKFGHLMLVCSVFLSAALNTLPVLAATEHQFLSQLQSGAYKIKSTPGEPFQTIEMEKFATVSAPGKPMLPFMVKEFALPENANISSVKLQVTELIDLPTLLAG